MLTKNISLALLLGIIVFLNSDELQCQIIYTDVNPDTTIYIPSTLVDTAQVFEFDLDSDGVNDFKAFAFYGDNINIMRYTGISAIASPPLPERVYGGCFYGSSYLLVLGDTINTTLLWKPYSNFEYYQEGVPPQCHWHDTNIFIGLKLMKGDTAFYGWVRCDADANSVTIKDYACNIHGNQAILAGTLIAGDTTLGINSFDLENQVSVSYNNYGIHVLINTPNPSGTIFIYNSNGQEVYQTAFSGSPQVLPFNNTTPGIYLVKIITPQFTLAKKVFVGR